MKAMNLTAAAVAVALLGVGGGIALASGGSSSRRAKYAQHVCLLAHPQTITRRQREQMTPAKFAHLLWQACPGAHRMATAVALQRIPAGVGQTVECVLPPSERPSRSEARHMTPEQLAARCHIIYQVKRFSFQVTQHPAARVGRTHSAQDMLCVTREQRVRYPHQVRSAHRVLHMTPDQMVRWLCGTNAPVKTGKF